MIYWHAIPVITKNKIGIYKMIHYVTSVKYLWLQATEINSGVLKQKWNELENTGWSTEQPEGWRAEEILAAPDHSVSVITLSSFLDVDSDLKYCFNSLVTGWGRESLGHTSNIWPPEDKGHDLHSHKEYAKLEKGDFPK